MKKSYVIILVLFAIFVLIPLGGRPMMSPDETRYAEIAREMIESGNWTVPTLNGVRYFEKPILGYWLFAGSMEIFGQNSFALRLPAALAALFTALLCAFAASKFIKDEDNTPPLSMAVYLTMPMIFILATVGILDGIFSFFVTASIVTFYFAMEAEKRSKMFLFLVLCGIAAGCAFLTKGFLAYALPTIAVVPFLLWRKKWKVIFLYPWIPFFVSLLVIAPWAFAVHKAEPDYWYYFVVIEHVKRFFGGNKAQHSEGPWYFIPVLLVGAVQYFLLAPAIWSGLRGKFKDPFMAFLLFWAGGIFILFSISSGKLPTYILPCFAPLSILFAYALLRYSKSSTRKKTVNRVAAFLSGAGIIMLALLLSNHLHRLIFEPLFGHDETWKLFILCACGLLLVAAFVACYFEKDPVKKLYYYVIPALPAIMASHFVVPERVLEFKAPSAFFAETAEKHKLDTSKIDIVAYDDFQAICWTFNRTGIYMLRPDEIRYGLENYDEHKFLNVKIDDVAEMIAARKNDGLVLIVSRDRFEGLFKPKLAEFVPEWIERTPSDDGLMIIKY